MKKILSISVLLISINCVGQTATEEQSEYTIIQRKTDKNLPAGEGLIHFSFFAPDGKPTSLDIGIILNGEMLSTSFGPGGSVVLRLKPGTQNLEITSKWWPGVTLETLELKAQEHLKINVNFKTKDFPIENIYYEFE